ncbi:MAG: hypothetical protein WCF90_10530 [Methanomicrobiales archaeon]
MNRLGMVPFSVKIPDEKCDPDIAAKLMAELDGILNWCLTGLSQYYAKGHQLVQLRKVSQATANLQTFSNAVRLFLATECEIASQARITRSALKDMFEKWSVEEGIHNRVTSKKFATTLTERGVTDGGNVGSDRFWSGIRPKNENERIAAETAGKFHDVLRGAL